MSIQGFLYPIVSIGLMSTSEKKKKEKITAPGRNAACKSPQEALFLLAESGGRPQGAQLYSTLVLCGVHS